MFLRIAIIFFLVFDSITLFAQEQVETYLGFENAVEIALRNNYDILLAKNEAEVARLNNTLGNAGLLPEVWLSSSGVLSQNNTRQEFANNTPPIDRKNVNSNNINASINASWTLFNGLRMFTSKERLKKLQELGEISVKVRIENLIREIASVYYDIVRAKQLIKGLNLALEISKERLVLAEKRAETGMAADLEILQARVDYATRRAELMRQEVAADELKVKLNTILARDVRTGFITEDSIQIAAPAPYEEIENSVLSTNRELQFAERSLSVSHLLLRETSSGRLPNIALNANYLFNRSQTEAGFSLYNRTVGVNVGFTASWTLFNGFTLNRQIQVARIDTSSARFRYEQLKNNILAAVYMAYKRFMSRREIVSLQQDNVRAGETGMTIMLERFKVGLSTSLELKEAQRSYEETLTGLVNALYDAKITEMELLQLRGKLFQPDL